MKSWILTGLGEALLAPVSAVLTFDPFAASLGRLKHGCGNLSNSSTLSHFIAHCRARVELIFLNIKYGVV